MYIYEILNRKENKKYVGQTKRSVEVRWTEHKRALNANKHANSKLQNAWNKYGSEVFVFTVVAKCKSDAELNRQEEKLVAQNSGGYNLVGGGYHRVWSPESRKKLSATKTGKPNGQKGTKRSPMSAKQKTALSLANKPGGYSPLVDPDGNIHYITNVKEFCRKNKLWFSGIASLYSDKYSYFHYKGWRVATPQTISVKFSYDTDKKANRISSARRPQGFPKLVTPAGLVVEIEDSLNIFCKLHKLNAGNVSLLINGKKKFYKGWSVHTPMEK